jgi:glyoxylase I family protein
MHGRRARLFPLKTRRVRKARTCVETPGLHHIVLTVSDPARSRAFYQDVLGFETTVMEGAPVPGFAFMVGGMGVYVLASYRPIKGDRFSEFRVGLDHLSFTAPSEEALRTLAERLLAAGVDTRGVERFVTGNLYIAFRDPDNVQLEYWLP